MDYLIWSFEHRAWWKPDAYGYTTDIKEAGRYSEEHAREICIDANKVIIEEAMVPINENDTRIINPS